MRNLRFQLAAATLAAALLPAGANAATLVLQNADFEANALADGVFRDTATQGGAPSGWFGAGAYTGTWNPLASAYSDHAAHGVVATVSGSATNFPFSATTGIRQTVGGGYKIQANTRYTLTVDIGNRADYNPGPWGYAFGLIAGDSLANTPGDFMLASLSGANGPDGQPIPEGQFRTLTLVFETGADTPGIGQALTVGFGGYGTAYGAEFDNFHLDATAIETAPVPEPGTWALMIMGFGLAGGALRRRNTAPARVKA